MVNVGLEHTVGCQTADAYCYQEDSVDVDLVHLDSHDLSISQLPSEFFSNVVYDRLLSREV